MYFQEQYASLSASPQTQNESCDTPVLRRESLPKTPGPGAAHVGGMFLALSIGTWAISNLGTGAAGAPAANPLASMASHSLTHLVVSGLAQVDVESHGGNAGSKRRREERLPGEEIDEGLLSAQMYLAAGDLVHALEAMHEAAELITASEEALSDEQLEVFLDTAEEVLSAVRDFAMKPEFVLDQALIDSALRLAELAKLEAFLEFFGAILRGEEIANAA